MFTTRSVLGALIALAACGGGGAAVGDDAAVPIDAAVDGPVDAGVDAADGGLGDYVRQPAVTIPPAPPSPDLSALPVDADGRRILATGSQYQIVERAPDPLTALADCTAMIVRCVDPTVRGRSLDACAISPARCATAEPWREAAPCCPTACVDRYEQQRLAGLPPIAAFRQAFFGRPSCAPGVDGVLGGAP